MSENPSTTPRQAPSIAIVDPNTLAAIGLKQILQQVMPMMHIDTYGTFTELTANQPEHYFHYFVSLSVLFAHRPYFLGQRQKTIVLSTSTDTTGQLDGFHTICINQPEPQLLKSLLRLEQSAHAHGRNLPAMPPTAKDDRKSLLSSREIEVLTLVAKGHINKEIADLLNISLPTVISHRRNIVAKTGMKSVSALTIYAVMHGYVDINQI